MKKNISIDKLCNEYIPLAILFATLFNLLIASFIISYLYLIFISIGILLIAIRGLIFYKNDIYILGFFIFYLFLICFHLTFASENYESIIIGSGLYLVFPIYWFLLFRCRSDFKFDLLIKKSIPIVVIISILGLIQYYFSPNLFGLLSRSKSNNVLWAVEDTENSYKIFFRATSILSSPQVFGLFTILYIFLVNDLYSYQKRLKITILFVIIISSFHSGNKMSFLIVIIFLFMIFKNSQRKKLFILIMLFTIIFLSISLLTIINLEDIGFLYRIIAIDEIAEQESEGRWQIYSDLIKSANWILGKQPGYYSVLKESDGSNRATESYFLLILLENGVIVFFAFLYKLMSIFLQKKDYIFKSYHYLTVSLIFSFIFVHSFTDPVFFVFWGFIFYKPQNDFLSLNRNKK